MFFTRLRHNTTDEKLFDKTFCYTHYFHCFSDVITSRYEMVVYVYRGNDNSFSYVWKKNNFPFTPSGLFYNLSNRFTMFKLIRDFNKKQRLEAAEKKDKYTPYLKS